MIDWPSWWHWELELTSHVLKRMLDRGFNEIELRQMADAASSLTEDIEEGRWMVATRHRREPGEIIVEPDFESQLLVVITAYPVEHI